MRIPKIIKYNMHDIVYRAHERNKSYMTYNMDAKITQQV